MGKKRTDETLAESEMSRKAPTKAAVESKANPEPAIEPKVEKKKPSGQVEPRISLREFKGTHCQNAKTRARIRALEIVMDAEWLSTNKTAAQWRHFCDIVTYAPVNEMKLSEWIKLATDGGPKAQTAKYAGILKQLEV